MDVKTLKETNRLYDLNAEDWNFYSLAYDGGKPFIEEVITQNPRESDDNYEDRLNSAINFNFAQSIVDLYNFYLVEKNPIRDLGGLASDLQWVMFTEDADLYGTNFDTLMNESQKLSSIQGTLGVLVDKFNHPEIKNVGAEIENQIYPYCALYTMTNILDWTFGKSPTTGRPQLQYLKLRGGGDIYYLWWVDRWEKWQIVKENGVENVVFLDEGVNPIGEIPFVFMQNIKNFKTPNIGTSDIVDISHIVASICQNLSSGEEIIKFAGFPIMRKPMLPEGADSSVDDHGVHAVEEFPPDQPNAKSDWMETVILEPIEAILKWIDRKADEIYRVAHLSGVHGQRKSNNEVASGLALRYEFQQLTSVLSKKADNMNEAELLILKYWLKWQGKGEKFKDIKIKRSKNFSVDDLSINLDNLIKSMQTVISETFRKKGQEFIAKQALPDLKEEDKTKIIAEIDASTVEKELAPQEPKNLSSSEQEEEKP